MKEFEGVLQHNPQIRNLDAVVGFLRASGYFSLRPFLDNIGKVRVLIGIDVDKYIAKAAQQGKLFFGAILCSNKIPFVTSQHRIVG